MSRKHQSAWEVWTFHRVVPSLVLKTVGVMHRVHKAFKSFDDSDRDRTQFIESRVLHRCDQFLLSWSRGVEPYA
jgi:hypothetical protein